MSEDHWFHLPLNPEPWRVGPVGTGRRGGGLYAYVGRDQQLHAFESAVAESAQATWGDRPPLEGNVRLEIFLWRQRSDYVTPNQKKHRKHEADATNMLKAIEDGLQGVVFSNDRDNLDVRCVIMEQSAAAVPQILVRVTELPDGWQQAILDTLPIEMSRVVIAHIASGGTQLETSADNSWPPKG